MLRQRCRVVWLEVSPAEAARRLAGQLAHAPAARRGTPPSAARAAARGTRAALRGRRARARRHRRRVTSRTSGGGSACRARAGRMRPDPGRVRSRSGCRAALAMLAGCARIVRAAAARRARTRCARTRQRLAAERERGPRASMQGVAAMWPRRSRAGQLPGCRSPCCALASPDRVPASVRSPLGLLARRRVAPGDRSSRGCRASARLGDSITPRDTLGAGGPGWSSRSRSRPPGGAAGAWRMAIRSSSVGRLAWRGVERGDARSLALDATAGRDRSA